MTSMEAGGRMNEGDAWVGRAGPRKLGLRLPGGLGLRRATDEERDEDEGVGGRRCCGEKPEAVCAAERRRPWGEMLCPWGSYGPTPIPAPP